MPNRSSNRLKQSRTPKLLACYTRSEATGTPPEQPERVEGPAAAALGRLRGLNGGALGFGRAMVATLALLVPRVRRSGLGPLPSVMGFPPTSNLLPDSPKFRHARPASHVRAILGRSAEGHPENLQVVDRVGRRGLRSVRGGRSSKHLVERVARLRFRRNRGTARQIGRFV